jgi:hypothetical protein
VGQHTEIGQLIVCTCTGTQAGCLLIGVKLPSQAAQQHLLPQEPPFHILGLSPILAIFLFIFWQERSSLSGDASQPFGN